MDALAIVNGVPLTVQDALRHSLLDSDRSRWLSDWIDRELLRQHAARQGITVSAEELQRAADEMRHDRALRSSRRTVEWLASHSQTLESAQAEIESLLLRNKILAAIPASDIERYYLEHRAELEYVLLFSIRVDQEPEAEWLLERLRAGEQFSALAAQHSIDVLTRQAGGWVGRLRRSEMAPEIAAAVFEAPSGGVAGPIRTARGWNLFLVADRRIPELDQEAAAIRRMLSDELLAELRRAATVVYPILAS